MDESILFFFRVSLSKFSLEALYISLTCLVTVETKYQSNNFFCAPYKNVKAKQNTIRKCKNKVILYSSMVDMKFIDYSINAS